MLKDVLGGRPDGSPGPERPGSVGAGTLFEVLGNRRRRHVIEVLRGRGERIPLDRLAEEVAAREHDTDRAGLSAAQRKRVYTALQQTHLPKMDRAGVLTFDKDAGTVSPSPAIAEFTVYLDVVPPRRLPYAAIYLGLAGAGVLVAVAAWIDVPGFHLLPVLAWTGLLIATFVVVAGLQRARRPPSGRHWK